MSKNEMTQIIASWIVSAVDDNGWRTEITNDAGFNRSRFNQDYVTGRDVQQLNRLYVAIANRYCKNFKGWWNEIGDFILDVASNWESYYEFIDSKKTPKEKESPDDER